MNNTLDVNAGRCSVDRIVRLYWRCPCGLGGVVDNVPDDYTKKLGAMYEQHRNMVFTAQRHTTCGGGHARITETIPMKELK
jgi:hypothetical protein